MLFLPALVHAEFVCQSEVNYKWKSETAEAEYEIFWTSLERNGADEKGSLSSLANAIAREKQKARKDCKKEHENLTGCIASKFDSMLSVFPKLSFSARKSLEEAITSDCTAQQGKCTEVTSTKAECVNLNPEEENAEEDDKKGKGKDKKKGR